MAALPMFPLGTVLVPAMVLPLHVFEPRYRALVRDVLEREPEFGVVLIERGSEVGGGDTRTDVGTVARVVEAAELPDGRWALATVGTRRMRVARWLDDDPYPRAEVENWPDPRPMTATIDMVQAVAGLLRRTLGRRAELGDAVPPATAELSDDVVLASYQMTALAPIGPADRQRLLVAPTPEDRLGDLLRLLEEDLTFLDRRLAIEGDPPDDR